MLRRVPKSAQQKWKVPECKPVLKAFRAAANAHMEQNKIKSTCGCAFCGGNSVPVVICSMSDSLKVLHDWHGHDLRNTCCSTAVLYWCSVGQLAGEVFLKKGLHTRVASRCGAARKEDDGRTRNTWDFNSLLSEDRRRMKINNKLGVLRQCSL